MRVRTSTDAELLNPFIAILFEAVTTSPVLRVYISTFDPGYRLYLKQRQRQRAPTAGAVQ